MILVTKYNLDVVKVDLVGVLEVVTVRATRSAVIADLVFHVLRLQLAVLVRVAKLDTANLNGSLFEMIVGDVESDVLASSRYGLLGYTSEGDRNKR